MIVRARSVVTMDGLPIEDGAVRVRGNRIAEVGNFSGIKSAEDEIVDLGQSILLPGLINAHCHLDYTCLRGKIPRRKSFTDWIRAINAEKAKLTANDYLHSIAIGFREVERFGTTAIVNLEAFPELIARSPTRLRTWWCAELIDVTTPQKSEEILCAVLEDFGAIKHGRGGWGLAPHAPFTASANSYRRCAEIASVKDFLLTTHVAESGEEMEMFRDGSGRLFNFLQELGRDNSDCGDATPLGVFFRDLHEAPRDLSVRPASGLSEPTSRTGRAVSLGMTRRPSSNPARPIQVNRPYQKWIVAHLNELTEKDFKLLAKLPEKFSIAHCPRSHAYFGHARFEFEKLDTLGFNICLATDSLASNEDLSLFAEMRQFHKMYPQVPAKNILRMVTANPARAIAAEDHLGRLRAGFFADMIALPLNLSADPYEAILNFDNVVPWLMIDGEPV